MAWSILASKRRSRAVVFGAFWGEGAFGEGALGEGCLALSAGLESAAAGFSAELSQDKGAANRRRSPRHPPTAARQVADEKYSSFIAVPGRGAKFFHLEEHRHATRRTRWQRQPGSHRHRRRRRH